MILVTGGAGFIGSHTCVELLDAGYEIAIIDTFFNSRPEVLDKIRTITKKDFKFYEADLLCREKVEQIFEENKIDVVMHLAAMAGVRPSIENPVLYQDVNCM